MAAWILAFGAFVAADLLTGASVEKSVALNTANFLGIVAAIAVINVLPNRVVELKNDASILYLIIISTAGAVAVGAAGMVVNPLLFGGSIYDGFRFWFSTELVNYLAVLPVFLSAPARLAESFGARLPSVARATPFIALILSCALCLVVGGPGAIALLLPALIWCGMSYSVFHASLLTAACSFLALFVLVKAYVPSTAMGSDSYAISSFRLGISFLALSPIMLAIRSTNSRSALLRLQDFANRDPLTGLVNRRAFFERARSIVSDAEIESTVLMLDIDRFKLKNDTFGHAAGDEVLMEFARRVEDCLRSSDLFGRLGGEEFALLLPHCNPQQGVDVAGRIKSAVSAKLIKLNDGRSIRVTVSIGMAQRYEGASIEELLKQADTALYEAKRSGRNRVEVHVPESGATG